MYVLTYDCDDCKGLTEECYSYDELQRVIKELKQTGGYNFSHVYVG